MRILPQFVRTQSARLALSILALSLVGTVPAQADVKYTSVMSIAQNEAFKPMNTTTTWLKDGLERTDSKQDLGVFKLSETTITSAAKRNRITFDAALKIYIVEPFGSNGKPAAPAHPGMAGAIKSSGGSGTGKIVMTVAAKFLGLEKLMDYQTRHYTTNLTMDMSGCCGTGQTKMKTETWMADVKLPVFAYPHDESEGFGYGNGDGSDCKVTFERKGDLAAYEAAQKGLALKSLTFDESGKAVMSNQITMLSFAALSDAEFAVPAGFKQVSRAEYDKQKQAAMMAEIGKKARDAAQGGGEGDSNDGTTVPGASDTSGADTPETPKNPDAGDMGKEVGKGVAKKKARKKFGLPF